MIVSLYDGSRELIRGKDFLIRIFDGFQNAFSLSPIKSRLQRGNREVLQPRELP